MRTKNVRWWMAVEGQIGREVVWLRGRRKGLVGGGDPRERETTLPSNPQSERRHGDETLTEF
ncbi:hypothetical protein WN55_03361 [Dufourea novaeangliae]|uniref:Uncharacterized protein n=1 Tax=Dufourea novaeangliae TaxID=178035 RepID=A0A154PMT3_DUFNO|nr:hypothetical protein WN55_03361 [Dufourea novaeangliae]